MSYSAHEILSNEDMSQNVRSSEHKRQFSQEDLAKIERSDAEQHKLRNFVKATEKFSELERSALEIDSKAAFKSFWDAALSRKRNFDTGRDSGTGRSKQRALDFGASAYEMMWRFSPILEFVKDLGAPYGSLAIGTMSFLFAIAKSRANMETQINSTLLSIQDRLPGIEMYEHIYNDNHELDRQLQSKVVDCYEGFIDLCIAAVNFYSTRSLRRLFQAMSFSTVLDEKAAGVQQAIVSMRLTCEDLLNKNVHSVKAKCEEQLKEIEGLRNQVKSKVIELQEGHDSDRLERVRDLLNVKAYSHEAKMAQLEKHHNEIKMELKLDSPSNQGLRDHLQAIRDHSNLQSWLQSSHSCLVILAGQNEHRWAHSCWISPVALEHIEDFSKLPNPCVFYIFGLEEDADTMQHALSFLALRLLNFNRKALRDETEYSEIWAELQAYKTAAQAGADKDEVNKLLRKIVLRVLNTFDPTEPIYIILDRVDKCQASPTGSKSNYQRRPLLKAMAALVKQARVKVRILAVVDTWSWGIEECLRNSVSEKREPASRGSTMANINARRWQIYYRGAVRGADLLLSLRLKFDSIHDLSKYNEEGDTRAAFPSTCMTAAESFPDDLALKSYFMPCRLGQMNELTRLAQWEEAFIKLHLYSPA
ncbi:hypothetical protein S40293_11529 [Stachybotrys chartarum IBT 40293]|nr:hypothetical protein S40293_11529 [Stachybotrys chartarum IBT 40293]